MENQNPFTSNLTCTNQRPFFSKSVQNLEPVVCLKSGTRLTNSWRALRGLHPNTLTLYKPINKTMLINPLMTSIHFKTWNTSQQVTIKEVYLHHLTKVQRLTLISKQVLWVTITDLRTLSASLADLIQLLLTNSKPSTILKHQKKKDLTPGYSQSTW